MSTFVKARIDSFNIILFLTFREKKGKNEEVEGNGLWMKYVCRAKRSTPVATVP
jgi:hypothetical protein